MTGWRTRDNPAELARQFGVSYGYTRKIRAQQLKTGGLERHRASYGMGLLRAHPANESEGKNTRMAGRLRVLILRYVGGELILQILLQGFEILVEGLDDGGERGVEGGGSPVSISYSIHAQRVDVAPRVSKRQVETSTIPDTATEALWGSIFTPIADLVVLPSRSPNT